MIEWSLSLDTTWVSGGRAGLSLKVARVHGGDQWLPTDKPVVVTLLDRQLRSPQPAA